MPPFHFSSVNLGCSKNLVDLEFAIGQILKLSATHSVQYYENPEEKEVEYVLINTCGFLSSSRQESEETLAHFDRLGKKLVLMGCYVSVKDDAFLVSLKNLHTVLPFTSYENLEKLVSGQQISGAIDVSKVDRVKGKLRAAQEKKLADYLGKIGGNQIKTKAFVWKGDEVRAYMHAPFGHEYLKIAEGCDNNCTFCIIPWIRGRQKSRPLADIFAEAIQMVESGIREIQVISQDTTRYGTDLPGKPNLIDLLEGLENLPGDFKIRAYYLYPDLLTLTHLKKLVKFKKLIPWFDIPFQHISPKILKRMGRWYDRKHIDGLLDFLEENFPEKIVRTSFIVGFPGETEADFQELLDFVAQRKFASVGVFQYHDEPLAPSSKLDEKVPEEIAQKRVARLGKLLEKIYKDRQIHRQGKEWRGYVMDMDKKSVTIRPELSAPEVDEYDQVLLSQIHTKDRAKIQIGALVRYVV